MDVTLKVIPSEASIAAAPESQLVEAESPGGDVVERGEAGSKQQKTPKQTKKKEAPIRRLKGKQTYKPPKKVTGGNKQATGKKK